VRLQVVDGVKEAAIIVAGYDVTVWKEVVAW
jgi:hypothetical protein